VTTEEAWHGAEEERKWRKANRTCRVLSGKCVPKHISERRTLGTRRRGRTRKLLLNALNGKRMYCGLKGSTRSHFVKNSLWKGYKMNEWMNEWMIGWLIDWMNEWMNERLLHFFLKLSEYCLVVGYPFSSRRQKYSHFQWANRKSHTNSLERTYGVRKDNQ